MAKAPADHEVCGTADKAGTAHCLHIMELGFEMKSWKLAR